ncbi:hypothetical protein PVAG01_03678 [Phlyctema vagabunda]|uniref:WKF domain-containing protein n=1 Tax=Phlyctema vagabunda TaxID=108571 RepID=A0ABR4PM37_9HELO
MPSANSSPNVRSPQVPAWKRLGLKLKFAQEAPASPVASTEVSQKSENRREKRKAEPETDLPAKKVKKGTQASSTPPSQTASDATPTLSRKKSVTFAPSAKEEDGDSIKQLFSAWVAEQKAQDPSFGAKSTVPAFQTPEPPKVEETIDPTLDESERRVKRVKKPKPAKEPKPEKTKEKSAVKQTKVVKPVKPTIPTRPFLAYLKQYHDSRATWKFNKNHQDRILKHIFDVEIIPSEYAPSLYEYVKGLQGGVRTRLRDAALAVKVQDLEDGVAGFPANMSNTEKKQQEYDLAMKEYIATMTASEVHKNMGYEEGIMLNLSDAAMRTRMAKRMRSEQVLRELGTPQAQQSDALEQEAKRLRYDEGSVLKVGRRRKQRTTAVDSDSSSSSDSSDSGSDDEGDSDDDNSSDNSKTLNEDDDTSSSSSSSSDDESGRDTTTTDANGSGSDSSSEESEESDSA